MKIIGHYRIDVRLLHVKELLSRFPFQVDVIPVKMVGRVAQMLFRPGIRLFCFSRYLASFVSRYNLTPSTVDGALEQVASLPSAVHTKRCHRLSHRSIHCRYIDTMQRLFPKMQACESVGNNRSNPVQSRCYRHNNVRAARTWWGMTDNRPASDCYPNTAPFPVEFFSRESFCTSCFRSLCIKPHNPTSSRNTAIEKKPSAFRSAAFRPQISVFLVGIDRIRFC